MYADARSTPPRVAAVVIADGHFHYCDAEPQAHVLAQFAARNDGQITSLEMLAIAYGRPQYVHSPARCRRPCSVQAYPHLAICFVASGSLYSATTRALRVPPQKVCRASSKSHVSAYRRSVAAVSGAAKCFDHCCLIHCMWNKLAALSAKAWVQRVPTSENIADDPSRRAWQPSHCIMPEVYATPL